MAKIASIQPGQPDVMKPRPYPFHVDLATGDVQQQSFWQGNIVRVLGFQADPEVQRVDLFFEDFAADPQKAVGMYVVGVGSDGLAQWNGAITSVTVREFAQAIA